MNTRNRATQALAFVLSVSAAVAGSTNSTQDLTAMSLEDLMNTKVTSVSKKEQNLSKVGAAAYVITQEDIRRSGMTNIPDLLRLAPGVDVARIDANAWAISIRGFNYRYSTKVLVLIDGRTVYTPQFSGVYWDQQQVPLDDIDRIEIIRGPGGTVWGANAVNGVINIITKSSKDTQGGLITAGTGSESTADGLAQFGGKAGDKGHYRVFARYFDVQSSDTINDKHAPDAGHGAQGGFRADLHLSGRDRLTVQGDLLGSSAGQSVTTLFSGQAPAFHTFDDKVRVGNGDILGRWDHTFSNGSETSVQVYYDHVRRVDQGDIAQDTGDADFQYHLQIGSRNDVVTGAGYRLTDMNYTNGYDIAFGAGHRRDILYSAFVQDQITLTDSLALTIGSKIEHNAYTGFEYEPGAQMIWTPTGRQTIWASAARAIQQPSWFDAEVKLDAAAIPLDGGGVGLLQIVGNPLTRATRLLDFEAGYRAEISKRVMFDVTAFRSHYDNLFTEEPLPPYFTLNPSPGHLVLPLLNNSLADADNYGAEVFANWQVNSRWRISPGFSFLQMKFEPGLNSQDTSNQALFGDSPKPQAQFRSALKLSQNLEWDAAAYFAGALRTGAVPAYTRVDTRLGWHITESLELSISGQNLLSPRHVEFGDAIQVNPTQVERSVFGKFTWRY